MMDKYILYPSSVKALAGEIIRVMNDYKTRKITNTELREIILWYANSVPGMLFDGPDYNPTVKKMIGKHRISILDTLLDGYQMSVFGEVQDGK